jgi:predicted RNA-binding protein with PUA-like domain
MNYWLVKSEPFEFSYDDLEKAGKTVWEGVRNYAARNHLREMRVGDLVLFYHSRKGLEVVGIAKVVREAYPDSTADKGDWSVVELTPYRRLEKPVPLTDIKNTPALADIALVRIGRLSVMPMAKSAFDLILEMGQTKV